MSTTTEISERLYTAEDLLTMPRGFELVRGKLVGGPRKLMPNNLRHAWLTVRLGFFMHGYAEERGGVVILSECGFIISNNPDTLRAPDLAAIGEERYRAALTVEGYFRGPPDLAVEVLSPSNNSEDMDTKMFEYFEAGVREVWTINVARRGITLYRADRPLRVYQRTDVLEGSDILPGFTLPLIQLFPT